MEITLVTLIVLVCTALMAVVLVQRSKGSGLSAEFGQGNRVLGVRKTAAFLEKATWGMALALFALCLLGSALM